MNSTPVAGRPFVNEHHDPAELLPLSPPVYHVLLALGDGTMHGYALMQSFRDMTAGSDELLPGTLYATLARMVETGLLEEAPPPGSGGDRRRRYYRVTSRGQRVGALESARMARLLDLAHRRGFAPEEAES